MYGFCGVDINGMQNCSSFMDVDQVHVHAYIMLLLDSHHKSYIHWAQINDHEITLGHGS